jgi:hypothetical protein
MNRPLLIFALAFTASAQFASWFGGPGLFIPIVITNVLFYGVLMEVGRRRRGAPAVASLDAFFAEPGDVELDRLADSYAAGGISFETFERRVDEILDPQPPKEPHQGFSPPILDARASGRPPYATIPISGADGMIYTTPSYASSTASRVPQEMIDLVAADGTVIRRVPRW